MAGMAGVAISDKFSGIFPVYRVERASGRIIDSSHRPFIVRALKIGELGFRVLFCAITGIWFGFGVRLAGWGGNICV